LRDDFYAIGHDYSVVLVGAVIDGETVNVVLATFSIENRFNALDEIADAVWDEVISKATHNVAQSAAKRIRQLENIHIVHEGTAQGPGTGDNTIVLEGTAHANDSWYAEDWLVLVENTGAGQMRHIDEYDGTTKELVLGEDWRIKPDNTTDYIIVQRSSSHVHRLEATALQEIRDAMKLAPSGNSPAAGSIDKHLDDIVEDTNNLPASSEIADAVCDEALAGHTTAGTLGRKISDIPTGLGAVAVDHNFGGTDVLRYVDGDGNGIDNADIWIYLKSDYDAGNVSSNYVKAKTNTDVNGRWANPVNLDPAIYTVYFYKQGEYGPNTQEITVT